MRHILTLLIFLGIISYTYSQGFNYQSIVRDGSGNAIANTQVFLKFEIRNNSTSGPLLYSEFQSPTTDSYGFLSLSVGTGTVEFGDFSMISWSNGAKYLLVLCAENANGSYNEIGSSQINNSAFTGPKGDKGDKGEKGEPGAQGPVGPQGAAGKDGTGVTIVGTVPNEASLPQNYNGQTGDMYIIANTGGGFIWNGTTWISVGQIQGPAGPQGPQGIAGPQGLQGEQGPQGPIGAQGAQGVAGNTGPTGPAGPANSLTIGSVTNGTSPEVSISGSSPNQVLNFVLQQGPAGAQGPQGVAGPANNLTIGTVTSGTSPAVTITGTSPNQVLNFVLQQGPAGAQGPQGIQGPAGPAGSYTAGTGITIATSTISAQNTTALWNANQIQGRPVSSTAPTQGQVLKWFPGNTPQWEPAPDESGQWQNVSGGITYQNVNVLNSEIRFGASGGSVEGTSNSVLLGINSTAKVGYFDGSTEFGPQLHNTTRLGSSSFRWSEVWSVAGLNQSSDMRLKKNITPLQNSLSKVMAMNPVSYHWKKEDGYTHIGFLAQELEQVLPEVVRTPTNNIAPRNDSRTISPDQDMYAVNYSEIIPVLVKAIQEQQAMIEDLKEKIKLLEK
jgi:hypothetical protein